MKNIILTLLSRGYSKTTKYKRDDLPYFLRPLFEDSPILGIALVSGLPFWSAQNRENRDDLLHDFYSVQRMSITDTAYFHILNRFENGDAYGMKEEVTA